MKLNNNLKSLLQHISHVFDMRYDSNDSVTIENYVSEFPISTYSSITHELKCTDVIHRGINLYYTELYWYECEHKLSHYGNTRMLYSYQISKKNMESLYNHVKVNFDEPVIGARGIGYKLGNDGKFCVTFSVYEKFQDVLYAGVFAELHITPPDHIQKIFKPNYISSNTYWYII